MWDIYECELGDVVSTGDSYGMSPCVCLGQQRSESGPFDAVIFLELTSGRVFESGGVPGYHTDDCMLIERIKPEQVEVIKKAWGVE